MPNRLLVFIVAVSFILPFFSCKDGKTGSDGDKISVKKEEKQPEKEEERAKPLAFGDLRGTWSLGYGNNYGYRFTFYKSYRSTVVLSLSTSSLVFRGVYNIEGNNLVRINISEMKRTDRVRGAEPVSGFVKAKSSYFVFHVRITERKGRKVLELRPVKIFIDGNNSEGYFEPLIKLNRVR